MVAKTTQPCRFVYPLPVLASEEVRDMVRYSHHDLESWMVHLVVDRLPRVEVEIHELEFAQLRILCDTCHATFRPGL